MNSQVFSWAALALLVVGLGVIVWSIVAGAEGEPYGVQLGLGLVLLLLAGGSWYYSGRMALQDYMTADYSRLT